MTHKTFFGRLIGTVVSLFGSIFKHVMEGAEKTFDEQDEETKDALIHGSGVMDFINLNIDKTPQEIEAGIVATFPDINTDQLGKGLLGVAQGFNLDVDKNSLNDIIAKIKAHLISLGNTNVWKIAIQAAANILAIFLAPKGTKAGAITSLMEFVYQTFFNKK